jgi:hypothetical protein
MARELTSILVDYGSITQEAKEETETKMCYKG